MRERLNDALTEFFALLALVYGNVLNVPDEAKTAQELAFNEDGANANDAVTRIVDDDEGVVYPGDDTHGLELLHPGFFTEVVDDGKHSEDIKVATLVVCRCKRPNLPGRLEVSDTLLNARTVNSGGNSCETSEEINSWGNMRSRGDEDLIAVDMMGVLVANKGQCWRFICVIVQRHSH